MDDIIPLFPLSHVLVPGMALPLHVFEPRYRQLLVDVSGGPRPASFGVVRLTKGAEVGTNCVNAEPEFASIGTIAEVLEVQPYDDGASDLFTVGSRRFKIMELVEGKPYLQGRVEYLDEHDGKLPDGLAGAVLRLNDEHARRVQELTGRILDERPPREPNRLSYHLTTQLPLTPTDRQSLLEEPNAATRLMLLAVLLRRELALLRATNTIAISPDILQLYVRPN
ncbi:MAG: LON peptidase substrate-binding domain-containing protein [Jatrophihabitantaceae bacterium]